MNNRDKSLVEVAIELQSKNPKEITFKDLFEQVAKELELSEEEKTECIAQFYADITSCGDFVYCGGDEWNLKNKLSIEKLDSEYYSEHIGDDEEIDEEDEDSKEKLIQRAKRNQHRVVDAIDLQNEENDNEEDDNYENKSYDDDNAVVLEEDDLNNSYNDSFENEDDEDDYEDKDYLDDDEDSFDEDDYNDKMDEFEDLY